MLPISTKDIVDFQPDEGGPIYRLAVPSMMQRAAYRRDLRAVGATYPGDVDLFRALRTDLQTLAPVNLEYLLELVDRAEAARTAADVDPEALADVVQAARVARALGGEYAALEGDRDFWLAVAPIVACKHFLVGWDRPELFERIRNLTSDATLAVLNEREITAVGYKALALMSPSQEQVGNSASPSPSTNGPELSQTA